MGPQPEQNDGTNLEQYSICGGKDTISVWRIKMCVSESNVFFGPDDGYWLPSSNRSTNPNYDSDSQEAWLPIKPDTHIDPSTDYVIGFGTGDKDHEKERDGQICFKLTINPNMHPPIKKREELDDTTR